MGKHSRVKWIIAGAFVSIGLGLWGFARAGNDFSPEPGAPNSKFLREYQYQEFKKTPPPWRTENPSPWLEFWKCVFSAVGLIRFYDLYQPGEAPWQLIAAQFLVPGIALFGAGTVFLVGVRKNLRTALARRKSNHTVVCGIGDVGMQVIQNLRTSGQHVVAVDLKDNSSGAATCEKSGVPLVQGDAKNPEVLLAAGIRRAQTAVITTGSDGENLDIALQINSMNANAADLGSGRIRVLAQVRSDWMRRRVTASERRAEGLANIDLRLFNPFTDAARMLIKRLHLPPRPEFEAQTFVLIGFGAYGREIALHLIRAYPVALGRTLKILVFDEKAEEAKTRFTVTDPAALDLASVEFVTASVSEWSPDLTRIVEPKLEEAGRLLGIVVAMGDDQVTLSTALDVRSLLDRNNHLYVPIYVRLEYYRQLGKLVREMEKMSNFSGRVEIFGTLEETLSPDVLLGSKLDEFAQALHADYLKRSTKNPQAAVPWDELPQFYKMSNRWRADHTPILMELAGMHLEEVASPTVARLSDDQIERLARLEHRRYSIERRLAENRPRSAWRDDPSLYDWTDSADNKKELAPGNKDYNRQEVAKLPQIMAEVGIELRPVRAIRLYGEWLAEATKEVDQAIADAQPAHYNLIVDLDNPDAIRAAGRALKLPSRSVWLISNELPPELGPRRKAKANEPEERPAVTEQANGWARKAEVALDVSPAPEND